MAKVALTNIYLVNWYGFINTKIPIGRDLTLITGENERSEEHTSELQSQR